MSTWEATNKLETLVYKISTAADVLEMIAVEEKDPTSGALWFMRDSLKSLAKEYEHEVEELYRLHIQEQKAEKLKKEKK
jgi:hypothetical protein